MKPCNAQKMYDLDLAQFDKIAQLLDKCLSKVQSPSGMGIEGSVKPFRNGYGLGDWLRYKIGVEGASNATRRAEVSAASPAEWLILEQNASSFRRDEVWVDMFADAKVILYREIDYRAEAENTRRWYENFKGIKWTTSYLGGWTSMTFGCLVRPWQPIEPCLFSVNPWEYDEMV